MLFRLVFVVCFGCTVFRGGWFVLDDPPEDEKDEEENEKYARIKIFRK